MTELNLLLIADLENLLSGIVPCIFVIIWLVSNLAGMRQKAPANRRPARPLDGPPGQDALENEIDKFLRQAKSKRAGDEVEAFDPIEASIEDSAMAEPLEAELVREPLGGELIHRHAVSEQVAEDLDTSQTVQRIERMGDNVEIADDVMAAHVSEVFEHSIGSLTDTSSIGYEDIKPAAEAELPSNALGKTTDTPTAAVDFAAMLGNSTDVRKAIVLNEILQRPIDRW